MDTPEAGDLVTVATGGPTIDGIVFDASGAKLMVAVIDRTRGPVLRPVALDALGERTEAGDDDHALQLLIRRTHATSRGGGSGGPGGVGRAAAHTRGASHRPTGR